MGLVLRQRARPPVFVAAFSASARAAQAIIFQRGSALDPPGPGSARPLHSGLAAVGPCFAGLLRYPVHMDSAQAAKFPHDRRFDDHFGRIPEIRWYPYVGKHFGRNGTRTMVFAHNAPVKSADFDQTRQAWSVKKHEWAAAMEEYTHERV